MSYNIDLQKIANDLDFDLEDVEMLIEVFLDGANESLLSLKTAIDENNLEQIFKSTHAIKGSSANLLLNNISNIAKEMEHEAREGNNINYLEKFKTLKYMISNIQL